MANPTGTANTITWLPIKKVQSLALNKIREFHPESENYQNIKRSIAKNGFYTTCPIYVRPLRDPETKKVIADQYEICNGNHRFHAAQELNLTEIPCVIEDMTDQDMQIRQYQLNESVPTTLSEKHAYFKHFMLNHPDMTQGQIAEAHSINPTQLSQILRLSKLSEDAKLLVDADKIKPTAALVLVSIPTEFQKDFLEQSMKMPVNEFIEYVKANRDRIKKAQITNADSVETNDFPPELKTKAEIILMLANERGLLAVADVASIEEYARLTGRVQALEEVLSLDAPTMNYRKGEKDRQKKAAEEKRALKRKEEADANLEAIRKAKEANPAPTSVIAGV